MDNTGEAVADGLNFAPSVVDHLQKRESKVRLPISLRIFRIASALAFVGIFGLTACDQDVEPAVIGAILPMTGPAAFVGEELRDGMSLAVDHINKNGGVRGQPLRLEIIDAGATQEARQVAYETVVAQDPVVTVAGLSSVAMSLRDYAEANKRLLVGLVATAPKLTEDTEWVYRYWPTAEREVPAMVTDLVRALRSVAVVHLDDAYGNAVAEEVMRVLGDMKVVRLPFPISTKDFSDIVSESTTAKAVVLIGFDGHIAAVLRGLKALQYDGIVISTTTATLPSIQAMPEASGVYVSAPAIYNSNYLFADQVAQEYEQRFDKPFNQYAANGYDFVYMVSGLTDGRLLTKDMVKARFDKGFVYSGLFGNVELKAGSHDLEFPLFAARIIDGQLIYK